MTADNQDVGDGTVDLRVDLDAHDQLPPSVRRVVCEAPLKFGSVDLLAQWQEATDDLGATPELEAAFCQWLKRAIAERVKRSEATSAAQAHWACS